MKRFLRLFVALIALTTISLQCMATCESTIPQAIPVNLFSTPDWAKPAGVHGNLCGPYAYACGSTMQNYVCCNPQMYCCADQRDRYYCAPTPSC